MRSGYKSVTLQQGGATFGGGGGDFLIYSETGRRAIDEGWYMSVMMHEAGHVSYQHLLRTAEYRACQADDPKWISMYARDNPQREDIAETIVAWFMVRHRQDYMSQDQIDKIKNGIPSRLTWFDNLFADVDMSP